MFFATSEHNAFAYPTSESFCKRVCVCVGVFLFVCAVTESSPHKRGKSGTRLFALHGGVASCDVPRSLLTSIVPKP